MLTVGVLAGDGGWRSNRDYTVSVRLDGEEPLNLKPSMRCKAESTSTGSRFALRSGARRQP